MACSLAFKSLKNEEEVPTPKQPDLQLRWVPQLYTAVVFLPTDSNNTAFNLQSIPPAWQQSCYGRIVKTSVELYSRCSSVKCGRVSTTTCTEIKQKSLTPSFHPKGMCVMKLIPSISHPIATHASYCHCESSRRFRFRCCC